MSTKCTIAYGENFHFYNEVLDKDHVYLQLQTTHYEAGYGRVTVEIPIHIWETIRHLGGARLDLADKTDEDLRKIVEAAVDKRIANYQKFLQENSNHSNLFRIIGVMGYGAADTPREEQIDRGMKYHQTERQRQQEVKAAIESLRAEQRHPLDDPAQH